MQAVGALVSEVPGFSNYAAKFVQGDTAAFTASTPHARHGCHRTRSEEVPGAPALAPKQVQPAVHRRTVPAGHAQVVGRRGDSLRAGRAPALFGPGAKSSQ